MVESPSSKSRRASRLGRLLQQAANGKALGTRIPRRPPQAAIPLSTGQRQVWLHSQLAAELPVYNEVLTVSRSGACNAAALEEALNEIIRRHEIWRTNFAVVDGEVVQIVQSAVSMTLPVLDLSYMPRADAEAEMLRAATEHASRPFDLARDRLVRALLVRLGENEHRLFMVVHQLIVDRVSFSLFLQELTTLYAVYSDHKTGTSPLLEPDIQYGDYAVWHQGQADLVSLANSSEYWRRQLADPPPIVQLPIDRQRPAVQTFTGTQHCFQLSKHAISALREICALEATSLYVGGLAAFAVLLQRHSDQHDLLVGTVTSSRTAPELDGLLGFFLTTLVLRLRLGGNPSFREVIRRANAVVLDAVSHDEIPFDQLVRELGSRRDGSREPLFQVMYSLPAPVAALGSGWSFSLTDVDTGTVKWDLHLEIDDRPDDTQARFLYRTDLFDSRTIESLARRFCALLESAAAAPDVPISELNLLSDEDQFKQLVEWNDTHTPYPDSTLPQLVGAMARATPDAPAVQCENQALTFLDLDRRANKLARYLRGRGVGPDTLVGLCVARSLDLVVGVLGVLKASGAYVPIDPSYPAERIALILHDAKPTIVLTQTALLDRLPDDSNQVLCLDRDWPGVEEQAADPLDTSPAPDDLAYVIYTSGSTGTPKGVMIEHRGLTNYLAWAADFYALRLGHGAPVQSSIAFDLTVTSLLLPLAVGRPAVLVPERDGPEGLGKALSETHVAFSLAKLTPAHVDLLARQIKPASAGGLVHALVIGGEQLRAEQLRFWRANAPETRLINEYGPTETVVGCCVYEVRPEDPDSGPVPIGRPIANTQMYVLDELRRLAPPGSTGELYIAGAGVARGYLNQPELTAERFVPNPFVPGTRMYRTGDQARYRPDGVLEFLGRIDDQVKIRGFRVEPGEVEAALLVDPDVRDVAVVAAEHSSGDRWLVAYVVSDATPPPTAAELRNRLFLRLPEYMVPTGWVFLDQLPLTINGKVDRKRLPAPERVGSASTSSTAVPQDALEVRLAQLWAAALDVPHVGLHDNFFDLGGYSLLAVRLFAEIEAATGQKLPVSMLFEAPTVTELAAALRQHGAVPSWSCLVPIRPGGSRPPFFCIHGLGGGVLDYAGVARQLTPEQPFYGIQAPEHEEGFVMFDTIEAMAAYYVEQVRSFQPDGPYLLGGYSAGGTVAYEMAQQLVSNGHKVALLALFDADPNIPLSPRMFSEAVRDLPHFLANIPGWLADFSELSAQVRLARLRRKLKAAGMLLLRARPGTGNFERFELERVLEDVELIPPERRRVHEMHLRVLNRYFPKPYPGVVSLFRAAIQPLLGPHTSDLGWKHFAAGGLDVHIISGSHHKLLKEPHIAELGRALSVRLEMLEPV